MLRAGDVIALVDDVYVVVMLLWMMVPHGRCALVLRLLLLLLLLRLRWSVLRCVDVVDAVAVDADAVVDDDVSVVDVVEVVAMGVVF